MQAIETDRRPTPSSDGIAERLRPGPVGSPVLVVDFEGAALRADPLHERLVAALKLRPWSLPGLALVALRGGPGLEAAAAAAAAPAFRLDGCPRRPEVERLVGDARLSGRRVVWLSREALGAAAQPGLGPLLGDDPHALRRGSAEAEAAALAAAHPGGFAYVGRSDADLPLWRAASERFGVDLAPGLRRRADAEGLDIVDLCRPPSLVRAAWRSARPHQWLKNLLVFVPFALSMGIMRPRDAAVALAAFVCLCALTSGTYLVNDLLDLDADRRHPRKRERPIARGDLPVLPAAAVAAALVAGALACACLLRYAFAGALGMYLALTLAYSFRLKRMATVDVLVIALLFTLRILSGMLLVSEKPSHWLLMFSIFFFVSLAFMKREVEFNVVSQSGRTTLSGRGYDLDDRLFVLCCGLSSGVASVVIFSLFISATIERAHLNYQAPELLWGVMGIMGYWVLRMWMLTTRGLMNDDPILFAARDRTSLVLGALCAALALAAQLVRL